MGPSVADPTRSVFQRFALVASALGLLIVGYGWYLAIHNRAFARKTGWTAVQSGELWRVAAVERGGPAAGRLARGDWILAIDGDGRVTGVDPDLFLRYKRSKDEYTVTVTRGTETHTARLAFETRLDYGIILWSASLLIVAFVFHLVGAAMALMKPGDAVARVGFALCEICTLYIIGIAMHPYRAELTGGNGWLYAFVRSAGYWPYPLGYHFASIFPEPVQSPRFRLLRSALYIWCAIIYVPFLISNVVAAMGRDRAVAIYYDWRASLPNLGALALTFESLYTLVASLAIALLLAHQYRRITVPDHLRRVKWILYGSAVAMLPVTVYAAAVLEMNITGQTTALKSQFWYDFNRSINLVIAVIPVTLGYAVVKHKVLGVSFVVRRGIQYVLTKNSLRVLLMLPLVLLAWRLMVSARNGTPSGSVAFYLLTSAAVAVSLRYRGRLMQWVDRLFFRDAYDQEQVLVELIEQMAAVTSVSEMSRLVVTRLQTALHINPVYLVQREGSSSSEFSWMSAERREAPAFLEHDLSELVSERRTAFTLSTQSEAPSRVAARLVEEGIRLVVPIVGSDLSARGALLLGDKKSEEPYTKPDRTLLQAIAAQFALVSDNLLLRARAGEEVRIRNEVLARSGVQLPYVKECRVCGRCFEPHETECIYDGGAVSLSLPVERTLDGKYRLDRRIGTGANGAVYEGFDLRLSRAVAVKVMVGSLFGDQTALRRFEREAQAAAKLHHPNIITIYDFGAIGTDGAFLVMEFLPGVTMRTELNRRTAIPTDTIATWIDQALAALESAHEHGVIHRDLKPENLLVARPEDAADTIKILDFGLAKLRETTPPSALTIAGTAVGTMGYISPEQMTGREVDERTDLFSMGVIAVELLTGARPFRGRTSRELLTAIRDQSPTYVGAPGEYSELNLVLAKCLAARRRDRYRSASELRSELVPAIRSCDLSLGRLRPPTDSLPTGTVQYRTAPDSPKIPE